MRTIYFDLLYAQPMDGTKFHGGGEYIKSVFNVMISEYLERCNLHVMYDKNLFLDDWIFDAVEKKKITVHDVKSAAQVVNVLRTAPDKENACFFTGMIYQYSGTVFPSEIIKIGVCHGLRPIEKLYDREQWRYLKNRHEWGEFLRSILRHTHVKKTLEMQFSVMLKNFDIIVTDSMHSEYSIKSKLSAVQKELALYVFYAPLKRLGTIDVEKSDKHTYSDYIMMISGNRWLKNCYRGIQALDDLYERGLINVKTKVFGNLPKSICKTVKHQEMFEFIGYVSTEELENAYINCKLFFYPSLNEGFGLPPMEAMKYGKTCVISSICSLPEVYGEAAYYCNPYDIGEMSNRVLMALENPVNKEVIAAKVASISDRQVQDTKKLCELIIG